MIVLLNRCGRSSLCWIFCKYSGSSIAYKSKMVYLSTVELGCNVVKGSKYFMSLQTGIVLNEECSVTVNSGEIIGTTEYLTL